VDAQAITAKLQQAVEITNSVDVPAELRPLVFERVLDAVGLMAKTTAIPGGGGSILGLGGAQIEDVRRAREDVGDPSEGLLGAIRQKLDLPEEMVSQIYEEQDGRVSLIVRRSMLPEPAKKAVSSRHVALLVAAGRQASGQEEWTPVAAIREECSELGVLDSSNFATDVAKLGWKARGSSRAREIRATRHHLEDAAQLIRSIAGSGSE
jgi:hypothetical protein